MLAPMISTDLADVIDCDVHPAAPSGKELLPFLDPYWAEMVASRGIDNLGLVSYPPTAPLSCRPDWRPATGLPGGDLGLMRKHVLDRWNVRYAILNCLHGAPAMFSQDLGAALCRAVNDWIVQTWLDRDARLRASIVIPTQDPALAAAEIDRCAADARFVQVLMYVQGDMPLGKRNYWPIYEAAERNNLPVGIHSGSLFRRAPTVAGWPSYLLEDYVNDTGAFQSQLLSLIVEGVFTKYPDLTVVLMESGFTWLPSFLWRANKIWRALRMEVPWVKSSPIDIVREHIRVTTQPADAPADPAIMTKILEHIGSDRILLYSSDYPHWQFEEDRRIPGGFSRDQVRRAMIDNPLETYPRLSGALPVGRTLPTGTEGRS